MIDYTPKNQFVVGTTLKANDERNMLIINSLKEQFGSNNKDIILLNFNEITEDAKKVFSADMLDIVVFDTTTYDQCTGIVENIENSKKAPTFLHIHDRNNLFKARGINYDLKALGVEVIVNNSTTTDSYMMTAKDVNWKTDEREREFKEELEIHQIANEVKEKMHRQKDEYTPKHLDGTSKIATEIAKAFGYSGLELDILTLGTLIHDIGKEFVSKELLEKTEKPNDKEYTELKSHVVCGQVELNQYYFGIYERIKNVVGQHHERYDGRGYPNGLKGYSEEENEKASEDMDVTLKGKLGKGEIDPLAEIAQVADSVHAMLGRVYQKPKDDKEIIEILKSCSNTESINEKDGCQFNPYVAGILIEMIEKKKIKLEDFRKEITKSQLGDVALSAEAISHTNEATRQIISAQRDPTPEIESDKNKE